MTKEQVAPPALSSENKLLQLNRDFVRLIKNFTEFKQDCVHLDNAKHCFIEVERCYTELYESTTIGKSSLDIETDSEKIEEYNKLDLIT